MFTGIIEEMGIIKNVLKKGDNYILEIQAKEVLLGTKVGASISINGVCLTVTKLLTEAFVVEATKETLLRSNLKSLKRGGMVNLERALKADGRLDGHIVLGHVDTEGIVREIRKGAGSWRVTVEVDYSLVKYIVNKGSITVDGISLTVTECRENIVQLNIIPHTFEITTLKDRKYGDGVNIEVDILAKYVEKTGRKQNERT